MKKILIIDDEPQMRQLIGIYLHYNNYKVNEAYNGEQAIEMIKTNAYDLILLDIMMPGKDGWQVCEHIREISDVPIIFLTACEETMDKIRGLRLGADDYLTKPFEELELLARIEAVLRRQNNQNKKEKHLEYKGIRLMLDAHQVLYNNHEIHLTPREFELLKILMINRNKVLSRDKLLEMIWGYEYFGDHRTVDSHMKNLREKLRKVGFEVENTIKTVWGIGYKII